MSDLRGLSVAWPGAVILHGWLLLVPWSSRSGISAAWRREVATGLAIDAVVRQDHCTREPRCRIGLSCCLPRRPAPLAAWSGMSAQGRPFCPCCSQSRRWGRIRLANALCFLGAAKRETGDYRGARDALNAALDLYLTLGDRGGEAEARNESAMLDRIAGDLAQAEAGHRAALHIALQIGSSWDEAFSHAGLGRCAIASGRADQGKASLKRAHDLYERADPGFARRIAAELDALGRPEPPDQTGFQPD